MTEKSNIALLLLSLFYHRKLIKGRTRFQKTVCLLKEKYKIPFSFNFRQYYYGPYSDDLTDTLSLLEAANLIREKGEVLDVNLIRYNYELTEKGQELCKDLVSKLKNEVSIKVLKEKIEEIEKLPTHELISLSKKTFK